jgi:hypothetical protein
MARKLTPQLTLDALEDEVLFTRAALKSDEHTQDLLSMTDSWLGLIDAVRASDRQLRERIADVDASRMLANEYLDLACTAFGDELYLDVDKDRTSRRWLQYFSMPVSRFIRQALSAQVATVKGWLGLPLGTDPLLDQHRELLQSRVDRADKASTDTRGLTPLRGTLWQQRTQLAESLTQSRDELRDVLGQRARELKLGRTWPDAFFKQAVSTDEKEQDPTG